MVSYLSVNEFKKEETIIKNNHSKTGCHKYIFYKVVETA
jgi:hypothetical protein